MELLYIISGCLLFSIYFATYRFASAESNEDLDKNPQWKSALKKIKELEDFIKFQDKRISALEKRPSEVECKTTRHLQKTVQEQKDRISRLEAQIYELEAMVKDEESDSVHAESSGDVSESQQSTITIASNRYKMRKERLLVQPTTVPVENVAFFAYLSSSIPASIDHHILSFDKVITNVGDAYHPHMGTFIAPRSGVYVFTWTIRIYGNAYHSTELLVDNNAVNVIYLNPANTIDGSVTGTAVVHVNQGNDVFIRTGSPNSGEIKSFPNGRSSFAGWILM